MQQTSTPVPTQACVHVDDEELKAAQYKHDVHCLYVERGYDSRDPEENKVRLEFVCIATGLRATDE